MIINYYGNLCVKVQFGDTVIAFDPPSKGEGKAPRFASDIVFVSMNDKNYNGVSNMSGGKNEPFVISGPGEYEVGGIFVKGIGVEEKFKNETKINTIYSVLVDDINLCHLGALNIADLKPEMIETLGTIDILFVPITGGDVLNPALASKMTTILEPKVIVPLYGNENGVSAESLKTYLKEEGSSGVNLDKLTIKKKDIEAKEGEIIILEPAI